MAIPIRMLNEIQYCERLFYIMHVQGLFEENADTIEGTWQHRRAEQRQRKSEAPEEMWDSAPFSLFLGDEKLNIIGKFDAIKKENNLWVPVEGKHSSSPESLKPFRVFQYELSGEAWPNDQIQLCAQGLLLRANNFPADYGYIYYRGNKRKVKIQFSDDLINATLLYIQKARQLEEAREIPKPLQDSNKCFRCSLNYICLPDETNYLVGVSSNIRRIVPNRADGGVIYISEHGTRLGKSGENLIITLRDGTSDEIPVKDIIHVTLFGNVQCSTQLIHHLMMSGISISYLSSHGSLIGMTMPLTTKNVKLREKQFLKFKHHETALRLARWITHAKISNQRTLLRRNGRVPDLVLKEMMELRNKALEAKSMESLRGIEGQAGKLYIENFPSMLKEQKFDGTEIMNGRNRRPPKDPVNALLSLGYTLLVRDFIAACASAGFDPLYGFFHCIEPGRPSLALDLMEPFRPLIVDSIVLRTLNTREIENQDFYWGPENCQLKKEGRKKFFAAYERRIHEQLTHPIFGYKISYRRTIDLECRILAKYLEGEIPEYRPLITR